MNTADPKTTTATTYGNLEITIDNISKERLDEFLDFVSYSAEMMGLVMVGRAYMTTDKDDDLGEENKNAKKPETTKEG
jgi:hypothetical protein